MKKTREKGKDKKNLREGENYKEATVQKAGGRKSA